VAHPDGIAGDGKQSWAFGQRPTVGATKSQLAVGLSLDLIAVFVDRTVMPTTQHREVRQSRPASVSPVADVMTLAEP
jgi:hypothetical protein